MIMITIILIGGSVFRFSGTACIFFFFPFWMRHQIGRPRWCVWVEAAWGLGGTVARLLLLLLLLLRGMGSCVSDKQYRSTRASQE